MKIAHISDLHIRNFKYRNEYSAAFDELYGHLERLKPDLIINTGDTVHSKLAVSPELFDDVARHLLKTSEIAPYWLILGNHDLNLKNPGRTDAISPVVSALQGRTDNPLRLLGPGPVLDAVETIQFGPTRFWNYDIRGHKPFKPNPDFVNVGLYHGSVSGCVTDQGFIMEDGESELDRFSEMDYVLMGDIHKRQSFREGRVRYPGSLIQQNYGEEVEKGFLIWDIQDKDNFEVSFHPLSPPGRFFTVQVPADLDLTAVGVPKGSRIRAMVEGELSPSKRMELEKAIYEKFEPIEVITPDSSGERASQEAPDIDDLVGSREQMMRDHLKDRGLSDDAADAVIKLFEEYEKGLDLDEVARGTTWKLSKVSWDNMMNFGEDNSIDLSKIPGLVGVFAPNASGKSSIFDIFLESLFDKVSKDVPRNIDLINDNKDSGKMTVEFESAGRPYSIERTIERIHYGQRKLAETKQWGKTTLEFSSVDDSLNGTSRPETERAIRSIIGGFEDFVLTTMVSQNPIFGLPGGGDIINCRETDRRKILFKFLDLDVYERVNQDCRDELKSILGSIKGQERDQVAAEIDAITTALGMKHRELAVAREDLELSEGLLTKKRDEKSRLEADDKAQAALDLVKLDDRVVMRKKRLRKSEKELQDAQGDLSKATDSLAERLSERPETPQVNLAELTKRMEVVRAEREAAKVNLAKHRDTLVRGKKALTTLEGVPCEGKFPTCKFISEASSFLTQRDIVEQAITMSELSLGSLSGELEDLERYEVMHVDVVRWERDVADLRLNEERCVMTVKSSLQESLEAKKSLEEAQEAYDEALRGIDPTIRQQIEDMKIEVEKISGTVTNDRGRVEALLRAIGALDAKKQSLEKELIRLDEMRLRVQTYEQLAEMTGKNGLPYRILTLVLPIINDEISKILTGVVKFSVFFEDDPDEQTVSLFIRYGDYKSRPLSLGSGAEKFIASLAIRVALLSVSSLPKTDILIIDEGFGKLDPEHLESLQRMFEYLKEAFGTVFIVSHVDAMRDIVDHSLDITSLDGYAHVEAI